jgi:tight adherence protein B
MAIGPDQLAWILGGGALLTVLLAGFALADETPGGDRAVKRRLRRVAPGGVRHAPATASAAGRLRRMEQDSTNPLLDRLIKSLLPAPDKLRARLTRTGLNVTIGRYLLICLAVAAGVGVLGIAAVGQQPAIAVLQGIAAGALLPHMVVGTLAKRRLNAFLATFPDAIDLIVRGLRSGLPVTESITAVGKELADPVGGEFRRISDAVRVGASLEEAMWAVAKRIDLPEFKYLVITMSIQRETGGNLAETLSNLSDLLRKRRQMKLKIKAMSSEARASAWIIGSLPFLMFGILTVLNPDYMATLLDDPRGNVLLGVGLSLVALGAGVMWKMVKFEI